jgi:ribosome-interacting GTPase 1
MLEWEGVHFQLVDLPAVASQDPQPWLTSALQSADACLLVIDLADPECLQHVASVQDELRGRKVSLATQWPADAVPDSGATHARPGEGATTSVAGDPFASATSPEEDVFALRLPALLVANKADRLERPERDVEVLAELEEPHFPVLLASAQTGLGLGELGPWLWRRLGLVRVYTKVPGRPVERDRPFTLRFGEQTVADAARLVHRDMARSLRFARVWGRSVAADGQHVGREHRLADGDVLELHA